MSFSVSVTGHLAPGSESSSDDIREAFENFIRALRTIGADPVGTVSGTENNMPFSFASGDVPDLDEAADAASSADEDSSDDDPAADFQPTTTNTGQ